MGSRPSNGRWFGTWNQVSIFSFLLRVINFLDKFSHVLRFTSCVFTPPTPFLFLQRTYDCILPECTFQGICRCWPVLTRFSQGFWTDVFGFSHFYKNREFCKFQLVFSFFFFFPLKHQNLLILGLGWNFLTTNS